MANVQGRGNAASSIDGSDLMAVTYSALARQIASLPSAPTDHHAEAKELLLALDVLEQRVRRTLSLVGERVRESIVADGFEDNPILEALFERYSILSFEFTHRGSILDLPKMDGLDRELSIDTRAWYYEAHRLLDVLQRIEELRRFDFLPVRLVRNHLIAHPEKDGDPITYWSFAYSSERGPVIKHDRLEHQRGKYVDDGLYANSEALRLSLGRALGLKDHRDGEMG